MTVVGTKYAIFVILLHTTKMLSYPCANGSFIMKSADICVQGFFGTVFSMSFPVGASV